MKYNMISETPRIFWAGDSTVKQNDFTSFPQTGIGQGFCLYVKKEICIINRAENGRSTKSFIDEGRLEYIKSNIREGDFFFIQFGHNDEKPDEERHTDSKTSFKDNLKKYIDIAVKAKAYPVLITPLYRRLFVSEHELVEGTHLDYPESVIEVAKECNVPVVDLCELSKRALEKAGDLESRKWFMHLPENVYPNYPEGKTDNTHLVYEGAVFFAGLIAAKLRELGGVYAEILLEDNATKERPELLVD